MVDPNIFRAYDIRGIFGKDINEEVATILGRVFGTYIGNRGEVLAGRDVRLSGETLCRAFGNGMMDAGCNVYDAGIIPTPAAYFGVVTLKMDGGFQVTASHNPPEWNGFKLILNNGDTVSEGFGIERIRDMTLKHEYKLAEKKGFSKKIDILPVYENFLLGRFKPERKVSVVLDLSNGAGCNFIPKLLYKAGCEIITINDVPDGNFPGHLPEPTQETLQQLSRLVISSKADFGVGLDGDADRAVFVDDLGRILPGDVALAVFVINLNKRGKVVYDVSSSFLKKVIEEAGCEPVESRVGRAFVMRKVRETGALIGGEKSNHIYFSDVYGFDDAIFAVCKMVEIISKSEAKLSEIVDKFPRLPSIPITSFDCPDEYKFKVVEELAKFFESKGFNISRIDGVKAISDDGWVLIRPSNTMPQIKMTAEARNEEKLKELVKMVQEMLKKKIDEISKG
ncbi:MAG: phosphomannomutase/phosphoglucomutase [Aigarchaeota archaeon]|nr:phosphomannomutase/phosphoglucomutase [Aigarchaeota archaeon]